MPVSTALPIRTSSPKPLNRHLLMNDGKSSQSITQQPQPQKQQIVRVALRVRPTEHASDIITTCGKVVTIAPLQKSFAFDHVFDTSCTQEQVFQSTAQSLIGQTVEGRNTTLLAYGQPSTGKSYTLGSTVNNYDKPEYEGIIPRAAAALFDRLQRPAQSLRPASTFTTSPSAAALRPPKPAASISASSRLRPVSMAVPPRRGSTPNLTNSNSSPRFTVRISFVEVHDDKLVDLLGAIDMRLDRHVRSAKNDAHDIKEIVVRNTGDVLRYLETGVEAKSTKQTHTVFTITVTQETWVKKPARPSLIPSKSMPSKSANMLSSAKRRVSTLNVKAMVGQMEKQARTPAKPEEEDGEWVAKHSKLHFVDLSAASIGMDDLLGGTPCSSPSSDKKEENCDTRLIRLLHGSTTMSLIACVSAEDLDGTEKTVKYASRARNNKVDADYHYCEEWMKNDNPNFLRETIAKLQAEVRTLKSDDEDELSTVSTRQRHISSSSWSSANSDRVSIHPSSSARTTITIPDTTSEGDAGETLLADLRQQIEELQNEVAVTRERNQYVEKELKTARSQQFEQTSSVPQGKSVVEESKPEACAPKSSESASLKELKVCLARSIEREQAINAYIDAIDQKISTLVKNSQDSQHDTSALDVIRQIKKAFKKTDGQDIKKEADTISQELLQSLNDNIQTKTDRVHELEAHLAETEKLREELVKLRNDQAAQIKVLTGSLSEARSECTSLQDKIDEEQCRSRVLEEQSAAAIQTLEGQLKDLTASNSQYVEELQEMRTVAKQMKRHMSQQEQSAQKTLQVRLEELERVRADLHSLQLVEEKQNLVIGTLDLKLDKMSTVVQTLRQALVEKEAYIELLANENKEKTKLLDEARESTNDVIRDVNRMGEERKQLSLTIQFMETALRRQDDTITRCTDQLLEMERRYSVQGMDLDEKQRYIEELMCEKRELEKEIETMASRVSASDEKAQELQVELSNAQESLRKQASSVSQLKEEQMHTDIELQRTKALESRVMELDEELAKIQSQNAPNGQLDEVEIRGIITGLESRLKALQEAQRNDQDEFDIRFERAVAELEESRKINKDQQRTIEALESSLVKMQIQLDETNAAHEEKCKELRNLQKQLGDDNGSDVSSLESADLLSQFKDVPKRSSTPVQDIVNDRERLLEQYREKLQDPEGQEELLQKLARLAEDNTQLATHVTDLEGQISLQRSKMALESKNLELEVIRLTSAKNRLEKEMEQVMSRTKRGSNLPNNRDSVSSVTSPPQTPRVMSPTRDSRLPKSVSLRSLPEENNGSSKRISQRSTRSRAASNTILPPPTAPPSNPLPPVPTALPPLPGAPSSSTSPPLSPTRSISSPLLFRHNSNTTTSASEITIEDGLTSERYEKIVLSMQRKMRIAENDVKAHQDVISKLESQLSRSEHMVREVKRQLDLLSREKQSSSIEIQNLRSQVTQARTQQQTAATRTAEEYKMLEDELVKQRRLKEKAEKARLILENRMEELMSKKNKFMCF